ncbi:neurotrimin isoform X2 [Aethina tumida]|uniref:neurotrimin isoform X2 n=1 Tax=Aethina tumida TaxID=116153 RepID=UPI00096B3F3F|nr:neurotrimin isoform X2 [Aethina tumida]
MFVVLVFVISAIGLGQASSHGVHSRRNLGRHVRNLESNGMSVLGGDFNHDSAFPRFAEPIPNVTVTVGRDALLACVVDNLRGFKVAWVRVDTQTILSIHHNVITQNPRISLSYNDHRSWYLHIKNVQEADRGWYMCQVNTDPMRSRQGYLQVVVPPSIVDRETSSDMVVLESTNVSLTCKATGYPEPYVMWRREDGEDIRYNGENVNVVDGEILFITKVSRLHMAVYLCIASNGVPPSISKRVQLKVQFPPMLSIPNQLEGAYIGQDVTLECRTEAFPTSINYWTTERGDMIISGDKYEAVSMDNGYKKYMMLKIRRVNKSDFGSYKCVAKNSLGETDGVIKLDEIPAPTTVKTTTHFPTMTPKKKGKGREDKSGVDANRVGSERDLEDTRISEYDYDGEYTLPSNGPPPIREPPGAFSTGSRLEKFNSVFFAVIVWLFRTCLR